MNAPESHPVIIDDEQISLGDDGELGNLASETTSTGNQRFRAYHETVGPVQNAGFKLMCLAGAVCGLGALIGSIWQTNNSYTACCLTLLAIPVLSLLAPLGLWWLAHEEESEKSLLDKVFGPPGDEEKRKHSKPIGL
jgi:hypothetical protein